MSCTPISLRAKHSARLACRHHIWLLFGLVV